MNKLRQKPTARETRQKPRWYLQFFIRFLRKTGEGSLKAKFDLPEREALLRAVQKLDPCAKSLIFIIENSGIPEEDREVALHNVERDRAGRPSTRARGLVSLPGGTA